MRYPRINWWKAIRIQTPLDLSIAQRYKEHSDALLLDAWSPDALGGTGNRLPLEWIQEANLQQPWWLAGGVSAEWITEMLDKVSPFGIDASSQLETSPGIKNLQLVDNLVKAVKERIT